MRHPPRAFIVVLSVFAPAALWAQAPQRTHEITVDDYFTINLITDCATSPDGRYIAYTELHWGSPDESRSTDLWVVETATQRRTRLTFEPGSDDSPQWAPDGNHIYFLTKRSRGDKKPPYDGTQQAWVTSVQGGEPFPVTRVKGGLNQYQLSADGRTRYFTKDGEEVVEEWKDLRKKYSEVEFGDGPVKYTQLWKLDLESWREEKLLENQRVIIDFQVAPNERRIAMITTPDDRLITKEGRSRVDVYDAKTKETTTLPEKLYCDEAPSPYGWLENLAWSSDGANLAWTVDFDGYPAEILIAQWTAGAPEVFRLPRPSELSVAGHLQWVPGQDSLTFIAEQRARQRVYLVENVRSESSSFKGPLTAGDVVVFSHSFSADGQSLVYVMGNPTEAGDLYLLRCPTPTGAEPKRLTRINPQIDTWKLPQMSLVTWTAPDGVEVEGVLELPPDYHPEDGPLPLVVEVHGGPTDSTRFYLQYWIYGRTLLPVKGYALLSPNYRGSTGYGDKFMTGLVGHENDIDVQDILSGVEAVIERKIADAGRLGVIGWSNGGFLTDALITTREFAGRPAPQFKAASTGAGVVDQLMQWGLEDTPGHVINYMRGLPWERTEAYIKASAAYKLGNVTTPTLIHVGGKDTRVPAAHSRTLYRGLKEYVGVPTVLLVYPGAGHGLTIYNHRKAKMEWDLAWFDKYLLGKATEEPKKP